MSLEAQLATCVQQALARGFDPPFCLFIDAGISASTMSKRPAMSLLMEETKKKRVTHIISAKLDRLWRNTKDALESLEQIQGAGASLIVVDMNVDTSSPLGQVVFTMLGAFAQFERKQIGERVQSVNRHKVASGQWIGGTAPYGYRYDKNTKRLEVEEAEARVVRLIYRLYVEEGQGTSQISTELNRRGYVTRRGNPWQVATVKLMMVNPVYTGTVAYGREGTGKAWYRHSPDEWTTAPGWHTPLIDPDVWRQAQERLLAHGPGRMPEPRYPYSGLCYCAACQSSLLVVQKGIANGGLRHFYRCSRAHRFGADACPGRVTIQLATLEEIVTAALDRNFRRAQAKGFRPPKRNKGREETTERDRRWWEEYRRRNQQMYREMRISDDEFRRHDAEAAAALKRLEEEARPVEFVLPASFRTFADTIESESVAAEVKRTLVRSFLSRVVLSPDTIEIHYHPIDWDSWRATETLDRPRPSRVIKRGR